MWTNTSDFSSPSTRANPNPRSENQLMIVACTTGISTHYLDFAAVHFSAVSAHDVTPDLHAWVDKGATVDKVIPANAEIVGALRAFDFR
jgi:hypothetical protein